MTSMDFNIDTVGIQPCRFATTPVLLERGRIATIVPDVPSVFERAPRQDLRFERGNG